MEPTLQGIRVLDLTRLLPGPYASWILASMGAEVLKVEGPSPGDYARAMPPHLGAVGAMFHVVNRGCRSLAIDLKNPAGRDLLLQLVPRFDVVFEQFRPGVMDRLGLGYDALRAAREDIILCSLSGYGQTGPLRDAAGHDLNYQAHAGQLWLGGNRDEAPPVPTIPTADLCGAMNAVTAIVGALLRRERQGGGAWLDISMTDSVAALGAPFVAAWTGMGEQAWKRGGALLGGGLANYAIYPTKDGQHLAVGALEPKFFVRFATICGHPEWAQTPPLPGPWQEPLRVQVAAAVASRTREEWEAALDGVDCCVTPVLDPAEAMERPLFRERGLTSEETSGAVWVEHPLGPATAGAAPQHGEHTDAVVRDELGLDDGAVAALRAAGVLH